MVDTRLKTDVEKHMMVKEAKRLQATGFEGPVHRLYNATLLVLPEHKRKNVAKGPSETPTWFLNAMSVPMPEKHKDRHRYPKIPVASRPQAGSGRKVWDESERRTVLEEVVRLLDVGWPKQIVPLVAQAQLLLPEGRRRTVEGGRWGWIANAVRKHKGPKLPTAIPPAPVIVQAPVAPPAPVAEPVQAEALAQHSAPVDDVSLAGLFNMAKRLLAQTIRNAVVEAIKSPEAQEAIRSAIPPTPAPVIVQAPVAPPAPVAEPDDSLPMKFAPSVSQQALKDSARLAAATPVTEVQKFRPVKEKEPAKPKLPSVLIVGFEKSYMRQIEDEYADKAEVEIHGPDISHHRLRALTAFADKVFFSTSHISHPTVHLIKDNAKSYGPVNGGVSELKRLLNAYLFERSSKALEAAFGKLELSKESKV